MSERIQPENNRTFTTGSGNWAGDLIWHGDTYEGHQGYISVQIAGSASPKTIALGYPAIKPVPGKENTLDFQAHYVQPADSGFVLDWEITDGAYSLGQHVEHFFDGIPWDHVGDIWTLPADWNIENSALNITIGVIEDAPAELAFDDFTLKAPAGPDYLPLMGAG